MRLWVWGDNIWQQAHVPLKDIFPNLDSAPLRASCLTPTPHEIIRKGKKRLGSETLFHFSSRCWGHGEVAGFWNADTLTLKHMAGSCYSSEKVYKELGPRWDFQKWNNAQHDVSSEAWARKGWGFESQLHTSGLCDLGNGWIIHCHFIRHRFAHLWSADNSLPLSALSCWSTNVHSLLLGGQRLTPQSL